MTTYPFRKGITGSTFPMSTNPYWSRVQLFEIQGASSKNYAFLAFKPGLPLQASELNEIQEINMLNQTLNTAMAYSWNNSANGPGWEGVTPLYPKFDGENTTQNMVAVLNDQIKIRKGWYLVTVKSSGMKHWVYLDTEYTITKSPTSIPSGQIGYLGFTASYQTVKPTQDPSLYDNSTGINIVTGAAAGADRIKVVIQEPFWTTNKSADNFSPMIKKINNNNITFMNNDGVVSEG